MDRYAAPTPQHTHSTENDLFVVEENPLFYFLSEQLGNLQTNNGGVPLWRNGMAVFWYEKHGQWLCRVNASAEA